MQLHLKLSDQTFLFINILEIIEFLLIKQLIIIQDKGCYKIKIV